MPIGTIRIRVPPAAAPPRAPPVEPVKVRIRAPKQKPVRVLVQPKPRPGVKQYTVLRYDNEGQYFVDEFVERLGMGGVPEDRRVIRHLVCPRFSFTVALAVCHRYCAFPCHAHLETVQTGGWYKPGGFPK